MKKALKIALTILFLVWGVCWGALGIIMAFPIWWIWDKESRPHLPTKQELNDNGTERI